MLHCKSTFAVLILNTHLLMKKFLLSLSAAVLSLYAYAQPASRPVVNITDASIAPGQTVNWTKNNVYLLDGLVFVENGATLNIEAGTVIKFTPRADVGNPSALIISRGGKIMAEGTAAEPIIFTAQADDVDNPNDLGPNDNALWGGLALLGRAFTVKNGSNEVVLEGIPSTETRALYGAPAGQAINNDNSGVMRYCSIRHGGRELTSGSELNGLSLGAVGSGTTLEYIEVYANSDDGIEFFGGSVNLKHAVVAFAEDDSYDWDETYTGKGQFWFSIQRPDIADAGYELDGSTPDDVAPASNPTVYNITHIGSGMSAAAANPVGFLFRAGTAGTMANSIMTEMKGKALEVQDKANNTTTDAYARLRAGELTIKNNLFWNIQNTGVNAINASLVRITSGADEPSAEFLINHLTTNANLFQNPGLRGVSRTQNGVLDPRPTQGGPAYSTAMAAYPANDPFFTAVNYKGAFSANASEFWLNGWTALSANGHLSTVTGLLAKNQSVQRLSIYPNPATSTVSIALPSGKVSGIELITLQGQVVKSVSANAIQKSGEFELNVLDIKKGIYILKLTDAAQTYTQKLVIE